MQRLLIATTSAGKLAEWRELLADVPLELVSLADVGLAGMNVEETGTTFAANARLKADAYGARSALLAMDEDAGLTVDALAGAPGVHSARWEGDDYVHKNQRLIDLLDGKRGAERGVCEWCAYVPALQDAEPANER